MLTFLLSNSLPEFNCRLAAGVATLASSWSLVVDFARTFPPPLSTRVIVLPNALLVMLLLLLLGFKGLVSLPCRSFVTK
jgi:hypothetical protein